MRKISFAGLVALTLSSVICRAQDIPQSEVPAAVVSSFQQSFSKANGPEWKLEGNLYKVEFETGLLSVDHDAWYDQSGKLIKHREEISKRDLPKKVLATINSDYKGYRIDDVRKITEGKTVNYIAELKTNADEWKVAFDKEGRVLNKKAD